MVANNTIQFIDSLGNKKYDINALPELIEISENVQWPELSRLLEVWFSNPKNNLYSNDVYESSLYNDTIIKMDWVLSFSRARDVYNKYIDNSRFVTRNFKKLLREKFYNKTSVTEFGQEAFHTSDPRQRHKYQWQSFQVNHSSITPDALDAALHNFNLDAIFAGKYYPHGKTVCIRKVGVYVFDRFGFSEAKDQYLGNWKKPDIFEYILIGRDIRETHSVYNSSFRQYQERTGRGGDFFVFSDLKEYEFSSNVIINLQ